MLAVQRKAPDPELFFVAGLIHDIGRLVFYLRMPDEASRVLESYGRNPDIPLYDYEKQAYGFDHGDVAGELLKKWDFPNSLIHAVRYHHRPAHADVYYTHAALISIADFVVHSLDFGNSGEAFVPPISPDAWDRLDLPMSALRNTIKETSSQFEETVGLFLPNQS
ncbi:MAG: HDOD domain protein [Verrucomicrobia bacterium ADurb.Bin474]|nr:MAG: HDOD domain protein [Verrucomicrobia bacterium ADurb.Bin474]